ncbi:thymidine kinase [Pseudomonas sp. LAIL14HWK12:I2]|jgi:hypothetical protein|uniref:hypothetical protein n=1 Tax=unclassified Pseudomonas TaxID=196821 RepID=UPI001067BC0C|nr:hypothetical protein [Pseudomonas sp. LAIL14HWK12:I2]TFA86102.1 thymidine kinase [Pseudomonas sp. LAIL14HWK12:I2]
MQVQVITGEKSTGKTTQLLAIQSKLKRQGIQAPILVGQHFTTPYFINQLSEHAIAGAKFFLADDCTQFQIKAVMKLKAQGDYSRIPSDFTVHLVRQA